MTERESLVGDSYGKYSEPVSESCVMSTAYTPAITVRGAERVSVKQGGTAEFSVPYGDGKPGVFLL